MKRTTLKKRLIGFAGMTLMMGMVLIGCQNNSTEQQTNSGHTHESGHVLVASTSWTGVIAKTAGAENVTILAPVDMRHPNEYDFKPSDVESVKNADMIFYSEYEPFMKKVFESAATPVDHQVAVMTENSPDNLKKQVKAIAEKLGTVEKAQAWEKELDALFATIGESAAKVEPAKKKAVVHMFMIPVAASMGYEVIGSFGPAEVSPTQAAELAALKPAIIIDNYHMPQGGEIAKIAEAPLVELRNFPETEQQTMLELIRSNAVKLGLLQ